LRITSNFEIEQERQYLLGLAQQLGVTVDLLGAVSERRWWRCTTRRA
jgi:hypothetical protein